ncbi:MAG: hypothetical protein EHM70_17115 [Chloroflexota bacterium]|nr:MAG: hypothetical protein EHM70_17115 [Chloroflexota bacterium]
MGWFKVSGSIEFPAKVSLFDKELPTEANLIRRESPPEVFVLANKYPEKMSRRAKIARIDIRIVFVFIDFSLMGVARKRV